VEPLVVEHLASAMENREEMRAACDKLRSTPERERAQWEAHLAALSAQEQRLERQRAGVYAMREAGETTAAQFAERRAAVEAELSAVRAEIAQVQSYLGEARDQDALWASVESFCEEMAGRLHESEGPECFTEPAHGHLSDPAGQRHVRVGHKERTECTEPCSGGSPL
jgi:septal ring factor EnvC (AmiA/AmiB activator)